MVTLYLVRHGETFWNVERRLQGWLDSDLTDNGIRDAKLLGHRLRSVDFTSVYASPSTRTVQTAKAIVGPEIDIVKDDNLREICMGEWEGRTHAHVKEEFPEQYHAFWNTPHLYQPSSGETFVELQQRVVTSFNQIASGTKDGNILVVSHVVVIKALLSYIKDFPLERLWEPPVIHGASLSIVEVNDGCANVVSEGDISHLEAGTTITH